MGYEHVSWCTGHHTDDGECEMTRTVELGEPSTLMLTGMPCNAGMAGLWVEAWMYELDDLDRLIAELTAMRPLLQTTLVEADCDLHGHPEDADGDDE